MIIEPKEKLRTNWTLAELAKDILSRLRKEKDNHIRQPAIGRTDVILNDRHKTVWVLRNMIIKNWGTQRDIVGNVTGVTTSADRPYLNEGTVTYRDSKM